MIKPISEKQFRPIEIDLTGPEGNAFVLIGKAKEFCRAFGKTEVETSAILKEMKSGDYENLITVFDRHFGEFATLYR